MFPIARAAESGTVRAGAAGSSNFPAVMPSRARDQVEYEPLLGHIADEDATAARTLAEQHVLAVGASLAG